MVSLTFSKDRNPFFDPTHPFFFKAGGNDHIDIEFNGSSSGNTFVPQGHLIADPLAVIENLVVKLVQEILFFYVTGMSKEGINSGQGSINTVDHEEFFDDLLFGFPPGQGFPQALIQMETA